MHVLPTYQRLALLTEGRLGVFTSKTAAALLRYRPDDVVALIDSTLAGSDVREEIPWAPPVPIVGEVAAASALAPDALVVGVAPPGGELPPEMRRHVRDALRAGMHVLSGLHSFLADDGEFAALARQTGARIHDLRRPPAARVLASGRARTTRCRRVLTVGTDGNVGKMFAALELVAAARRRGLRGEFVATGQTGMLIAGRGAAVDAIPADFAPGVVEQMVVSAGNCDVCVVEGQGSIAHPGFSAVTLALLHGACPDALVLVHHVGRTHYRSDPTTRIPPLRELRAAYEQIASLLHPARVVGVALNPVGLSRARVDRECRSIRDELGVPVSDPGSGGADELLAAALAE